MREPLKKIYLLQFSRLLLIRRYQGLPVVNQSEETLHFLEDHFISFQSLEMHLSEHLIFQMNRLLLLIIPIFLQRLVLPLIIRKKLVFPFLI